MPAEFLPRLKARHGGVSLRGPFAHRWFGKAAGLDVAVFSTRPLDGVSRHLVSDRLGHWIAFAHDTESGRRRMLGWSARGRGRLQRAFLGYL